MSQMKLGELHLDWDFVYDEEKREALEHGFPESLLDEYCYVKTPNLVYKKILRHLMEQGIRKKHWVVKTRISELTRLHDQGVKYTHAVLDQLRGKRILVDVDQEKKDLWIFLIPALRKFVAYPKDQPETMRLKTITKEKRKVIQRRGSHGKV